MYNQQYLDQVAMVLRCLPALRKQSQFALKGGTAINLFELNLPRLSVDIDLTYVPLQYREKSLLDIETGLRQIADEIKRFNPDFYIKEQVNQDTQRVARLFVYHNDVMIKIKVDPYV